MGKFKAPSFTRTRFQIKISHGSIGIFQFSIVHIVRFVFFIIINNNQRSRELGQKAEEGEDGSLPRQRNQHRLGFSMEADDGEGNIRVSNTQFDYFKPF